MQLMEEGVASSRVYDMIGPRTVRVALDEEGANERRLLRPETSMPPSERSPVSVR